MVQLKYEYIGDISQLFRVETYRLEGGRKEGIRATNVSNEIGYPFLSPECEILIPLYMVNGANKYSQDNIDKWNVISEPSEVGEMCYIHRMREDGSKCAGMFSPKWGFGFVLQYEGEDLDKFLQWRYLNKGEYVIGLEPATNCAGGRKIEKDKTGLKRIAPGQSVKHKLKIVIYDSYEEIKDKIFN